MSLEPDKVSLVELAIEILIISLLPLYYLIEEINDYAATRHMTESIKKFNEFTNTSSATGTLMSVWVLLITILNSVITLVMFISPIYSYFIFPLVLFIFIELWAIPAYLLFVGMVFFVKRRRSNTNK